MTSIVDESNKRCFRLFTSTRTPSRSHPHSRFALNYLPNRAFARMDRSTKPIISQKWDPSRPWTPGLAGLVCARLPVRVRICWFSRGPSCDGVCREEYRTVATRCRDNGRQWAQMYGRVQACPCTLCRRQDLVPRHQLVPREAW